MVLSEGLSHRILSLVILPSQCAKPSTKQSPIHVVEDFFRTKYVFFDDSGVSEIHSS